MSIQSDLLSAQKVHVPEYTLELFSLLKLLYLPHYPAFSV